MNLSPGVSFIEKPFGFNFLSESESGRPYRLPDDGRAGLDYHKHMAGNALDQLGRVSTWRAESRHTIL